MKQFFLAPGDDASRSFTSLLKDIKAAGEPAVISLQEGRYLFSKKDSAICDQPVSNTFAYDGSVPRKHVGVLLDGLAEVTIEGNGAHFVFDGDMSGIALMNCHNIALRNFSMDWLHPRVVEMRCVASSGNEAEFQLHKDSRAVVQGGRLFFLNPDGRQEPAENWIVQCAAADGKSNLRSGFHPYAEAAKCIEIAPGRLLFQYDDEKRIEVGSVWQFRNPTRNENGIFLHQCQDVELEHLKLYFTPGLGVIAQLCSNLNIHNHTHAPESGNGRVCAAFADCIQISSCRGRVCIADSVFSGSQDDPVNIHGTYLGVQCIDGYRIQLEFRHPETWGFLPFEPGDDVALVEAETLRRLHFAHVRQASLKDFRHIELEVDSLWPKEATGKNFVVENLSASPNALVENNILSCYPTRGLLITTSATGIVRNNTFNQTPPRPAIHIASDAYSWFESGGVRDLLIVENRFKGCTVPAINIWPNNNDRYPIHQGIRIRNNTFVGCTAPYLRVLGCAELESDIESVKLQ